MKSNSDIIIGLMLMGILALFFSLIIINNKSIDCTYMYFEEGKMIIEYDTPPKGYEDFNSVDFTQSMPKKYYFPMCGRN